MKPIRIDIQNVFYYLVKNRPKRDIPPTPIPWDDCIFTFRARQFDAFSLWQPFIAIECHTFYNSQLRNGGNKNEADSAVLMQMHIDGDATPSAKLTQGFDVNGLPDGDSRLDYNDSAYLSPDSDVTEDIIIEFYTSVFFIVWFAAQLAHCKNVHLIDQPLTRQQRRRKERKGETYYKVLSIEPFKKQVRNEASSNGHSEIERAMHICRGHFVTYSEERPLFGKYAGTYWKPMHLRGKRSAGMVVKDYEVKP